MRRATSEQIVVEKERSRKRHTKRSLAGGCDKPLAL
jgi:hypothetical protein